MSITWYLATFSKGFCHTWVHSTFNWSLWDHRLPSPYWYTLMDGRMDARNATTWSYTIPLFRTVTMSFRMFLSRWFALRNTAILWRRQCRVVELTCGVCPLHSVVQRLAPVLEGRFYHFFFHLTCPTKRKIMPNFYLTNLNSLRSIHTKFYDWFLQLWYDLRCQQTNKHTVYTAKGKKIMEMPNGCRVLKFTVVARVVRRQANKEVQSLFSCVIYSKGSLHPLNDSKESRRQSWQQISRWR